MLLLSIDALSAFCDPFGILTLFETEKYIVVNYRSNGKIYMLLYDKETNTYSQLASPKPLFDKSMVADLTTIDIWSYILFSFTRLYSDNEIIYGRMPYSVYTILSASESLFDEKISAFYKQLKNYVLSNNLSDGEEKTKRLENPSN